MRFVLCVGGAALTLVSCVHHTSSPSSPSGASPARARIDAAIARGDHTHAPIHRMEITAAPISEMPLAVNGAKPTAIRIHDDYWPIRLLEDGGNEASASFEQGGFRQMLMRECFATSFASTRIVTDITLARPSTTVASGDTADSALATCVSRVLATSTVPYLRLTLRVTTRLVTSGAHPQIADSDRKEELAALDSLIANAPSVQTKTTWLLLAGSRHLLAAENVAAAIAFENVLTTAVGIDDDAITTRAAALSGLALARDLGDKPNEAIVPWRALVCPSRFTFPDAYDKPLDQDHPKVYWDAWEQMHPTPIAKTPSTTKHPAQWDEETKYRSPYEGCQPLKGASADVVSYAWRRIAAYHQAADTAAGPFKLNRAITALRFAFAAAAETTKAFVALDLAHAYLQAQRYREAAHVLRAALSAKPVDEDFTLRLGQLLATALTHFDLDGVPSETDPTPGNWPDLVDVETNQATVARNMTSVIDPRIDDPDLVPQSPSTKALVLRWLTWELLAQNMFEPAIAASRSFAQRFPLHRDAPLLQWDEVVARGMIVLSQKPASPAAIEAAKLDVEARTRLTTLFVGATPWTEANKTDAKALARAIALVHDVAAGGGGVAPRERPFQRTPP